MNTTGFVNKKPPIFGEDTHAADAVEGTGGTAESTGSQASCDNQSILGSIGTNRATVSNITTPTNSSQLVFVLATMGQLRLNFTDPKTWRIMRNTTQLFSISMPGANQQETHTPSIAIRVEDSPPAGTYSYHAQEGDNDSFGGVSLALQFIEADLTGSNSQTTNEDVLLS